MPSTKGELMRIKISVMIESGAEEIVQDVAVIERECVRLGQVGLSLAEVKDLWKGIQRMITEA